MMVTLWIELWFVFKYKDSLKLEQGINKVICTLKLKQSLQAMIKLEQTKSINNIRSEQMSYFIRTYENFA